MSHCERLGNDRGVSRLNAICPYFTMFPLDFPVSQLRKEQDSWVLDPFCGRGTTNFAARLRGLPTVGVDSSPVAAAIAAGKLADTAASEVIEECQAILRNAAEPRMPAGPFWEACYHNTTLRDLCRVRDALLRSCASPQRVALRALLLGLLHGPLNKGVPSYLSNQMPRTYATKPSYSVEFWRRRQMRPPKVDLGTLVERKASYYFDDQPPAVQHRVIMADSRSFRFSQMKIPFGRVITSPPYYGMRTYLPDQWIRNWFLGGSADVDYSMYDQLIHNSPQDFAAQLADVWRNVADACSEGAKVLVRFGGIHDRHADPREIMLESLSELRSRFRLVTVRSAGTATRGKRQAAQFQRPLRRPIEEYDFHLRVRH